MDKYAELIAQKMNGNSSRVIRHHTTKPKKLRNVTPKKEPKQLDLFTWGSHGGIDDEYYINEIIGIDECNYDDFTGGKKND